MLSDIFENDGMVRILDYLCDLIESHGTFSQKDVCEFAKVSRPTAVRAFKRLVRHGLIRKVKHGYRIVWGERSPIRALMRFDLLMCMKENNRIAKVEIEKDKKRESPIYLSKEEVKNYQVVKEVLRLEEKRD